MADMSEYPLDAVPMFVLQVAPLDVHGGHVKDLPALPLPSCPFGEFSLSVSPSLFHALSTFSLYVDV